MFSARSAMHALALMCVIAAVGPTVAVARPADDRSLAGETRTAQPAPPCPLLHSSVAGPAEIGAATPCAHKASNRTAAALILLGAMLLAVVGGVLTHTRRGRLRTDATPQPQP